MSRAPHLLLSALLLGGSASQATAMRVCLEDRVGMGVPARAGLVGELRALAPDVEVEIRAEGCNGIAGSDVVLTVLGSRPEAPSDALGLAYRGNGTILPRLEVFVDPVMRLTRAADWQTLGRALARVAAHELLHYRRQTDEHDASGLFQARLTPTELLSEELRPRLAAALHHD
jgi:hypothetical protein